MTGATPKGPFALGAPPAALRIDAPSLTAFGFTEIRRAVEVAILGTYSVLRALALGFVRRRTSGEGFVQVLCEGVVDAMERLGPTYVKLGQMIASAPGVFPPPLADACLRCLDEVGPFPSDQARKIVEDDLGAPMSQLFTSFDDTPLSAASIAQVHSCTLLDGTEAVLKIQRPDIRNRMNHDLRIMYRIARLLMRTEKGRLANAQGVVEDLHQVTNEELNAALEAHRQTFFRDHIGDFGDNKWITAPEVFWDRCGPRVICMERMYGTPMDQFDELEKRNIDGELVLRRGIKVWMEAALVHGPFHGDVHAGNLWVLEDGRASYLDFGIMGVLPPMHREAVAGTQYTAMIDGDYTRIVEAWQRLGILGDDLGPVEDVAARLKMVMDPMLDMSMGEMSLGEMMNQQMEMAQDYGAQSPRELVLVTKQLMYFERYAKALAPDYKLSRDVFLIKNVFPEAVAEKVATDGIELPDDDTSAFRTEPKPD